MRSLRCGPFAKASPHRAAASGCPSRVHCYCVCVCRSSVVRRDSLRSPSPIRPAACRFASCSAPSAVSEATGTGSVGRVVVERARLLDSESTAGEHRRSRRPLARHADRCSDVVHGLRALISSLRMTACPCCACRSWFGSPSFSPRCTLFRGGSERRRRRREGGREGGRERSEQTQQLRSDVPR